MMREFKTGGSYSNTNVNNNSSKQQVTTEYYNGSSVEGLCNNVSSVSAGSITDTTEIATNASAIACGRLSSTHDNGLVVGLQGSSGDLDLYSHGSTQLPNSYNSSTSSDSPSDSMDNNTHSPNAAHSAKQRKKSSNKTKLVSLSEHEV